MGILALSGVVHAQKNQFPWDDYRVEGDLTTIHVQGNVYMIHGLGGNVRSEEHTSELQSPC